MPDPAPTRHEQQPAAGPAPTRRETPGAASSAVLAPGALPPALESRLSELTLMPTQGAEADLLWVRDTAHPGGKRVLKIYRPQLAPDAEVWSELTSVRSPFVVKIVQTGQLADGRFFELMEYLPEGNLRGLGAGRDVFEPGRITEVVRQLCGGLAALHARGITHRDLKPENVLVRSVDPIELVLTDFGLSRRLDRSMVFSTDARTSAYAAPEAYSKHVSPARDWWSLGIMVLELATGVRPFHDLDELMIQKAVTTRPVPVDAVTDARLNRLCAGLLVADDAKRWGLAEVESWLAGGSPAVPDRRVPLEVRAFAFGDAYYSDPESLAAAMAQQWPAAARGFFVTLGESWESLKIWLRQFDDPARYPASVVASRHQLLDELQVSTAAPNTKLLRLLEGLNPGLPPTYRQTLIDIAGLRALARAVGGDPDDGGTRTAREVVVELWNDRLLDVLDRFAGSDQLAAVDARWRLARGRWDSAVAELHGQPQYADVLTTPETGVKALAATLELATGADRRADWLRALDERGRALPVPVAWYDELRSWAGDDPVRAFVAWCASGAAQAEAEQELRTRQAAEQAERLRARAWAEREERRLAGRTDAKEVALRGVALMGLVWLAVGLVSAKTVALAIALVVLMVAQLVAELKLVDTLGADYHPRYSLRQTLGEAAGRLGPQLRAYPGPWAAGIIVLLIALVFLGSTVPLLIVAVAHVIWAFLRYQRWSQAHEQEQGEAMSR